MDRRQTRIGPTGWRIGGLLAVVVIVLIVGDGVLDVLAEFGGENVTNLIASADGSLQYALVFVMAAIPWLEILIVIPVGVGLGLNAIGVAGFAFLGNVLPIYGIIAFYGRLKAWWGPRHEDDDASNRHERAKRIWNRYGLPGFALVSPAVIGVHLASFIALALGSRKRAVAIWMTVAIALWTILFTAGSYYGIGYIVDL